MATVIRTDMRGYQCFVFLVAALVIIPAASGTEPEIYVTTGLDGVEVFSNLPRGSANRQEVQAMAAKGRAVIISRQSLQTLAAVVDDQRPASNAEATGKSFLEDD